MNAAQLIANAYYLSGIRSRSLEDVTETDTADGLELLNDILSEKSIDATLINYYSHTDFNAVPGEEEYDIPGLIEIDALTFNIGTVRYKMRRDFRKEYFGSSRVDDIKTLPFHYYAERQLGGMKLYLYFIPDEDYLMKITGKFSLTEITDPAQDITDLDRFYTSYLKYELASRICQFFQYDFPNQNMQTLGALRRDLEDMVGLDLSIEKESMFPAKVVDPYGQANLGRGWTTP
jgi:hypothetical protein